MTGILIEYGRFVEVQRRRARIVAEFNRMHEGTAPRTRTAQTSSEVEVTRRPTSVVDVNTADGACRWPLT